MRHGILAGGNWILDRVKIINTWPAEDTLATILREFSGNGGSPYNLLVDLARLGARFPLTGIGMVGNDDNGRAILRDCGFHGINTEAIRVTSEAATSYTDVMTVAATGRRTFFHQRGANALLNASHFDFTASSAKIFHLGYLLLLDGLDALLDGIPNACDVLRRAKAAGLLTSLDCVSAATDRFQAVVLPVLPFVDVLFANDLEAEMLTGIPLRRKGRIHRLSVERAAKTLIASGVRSWVVIHFPEAAYARDAGGVDAWQSSVQVPPGQIAGAAGAGDALAAGVLLGRHEGWSMERCLRLGVCSAAASLHHPSCSEGVQPFEVCLAKGDRYGFRPFPS